MAYSSGVNHRPDYETSSFHETLSTSWGNSTLPLRLSEDDIGYGNKSPSPDDDYSSTRNLIRHTSASNVSTHSVQNTSGKYFAVDQGNEAPIAPREEGFSFGLSLLRRGRPGLTTHHSSRSSVFRGQLATHKPGWWNRQMLVDRSLRTMAATMTLFAIVMWVICIIFFKTFITRPNKNSTSVGGKQGESCETMETRNVAVHFFINISATMILGMSNTYQQLVTSLNVDDLRHVLSKKGDSRVGTNSPFAINDKQKGKLKYWLAWILLIATSLPVHFLANSLVGPSLYVEPPGTVLYEPTTNLEALYSIYGTADDLACWTAFRGGAYHFPENTTDTPILPDLSSDQKVATYSLVNVTYNKANCTKYHNTTSPLVDFNNEIIDEYGSYGIGDCLMATDVYCTLQGHETFRCRLNVRMQAAFILAGCLTIKAVYMIATILHARGKVKKQCLTFGDVIVASALDTNLRLRNECLVNAGDGYRHQVSHTCHKHCKSSVSSATGDEMGHCQKCKKFNTKDKAANLIHPILAIKYKKSLISNLGTTAVTQMILLFVASLAMFGLSLMFAVLMGGSGQYYDHQCRLRPDERDNIDDDFCYMSRSSYLKDLYGSWGGFNSSVVVASLPADSLASEQTAFWISNGAQLLYSLLYLLLIYNITLISMEHDWGKFEIRRQRPRCTIVRGDVFEQSYLLQLPKKILFPLMAFSALMHWLLGQAISTREIIWSDLVAQTEHAQYEVVTASYPVFLSTTLMIGMTALCWWAFTFKREGFIPQMYGSVRACCASTTELDDFTRAGIIWGDLGNGEKFRHAGFSSGEVGKIIPGDLYAGRDGEGGVGRN